MPCTKRAIICTFRQKSLLYTCIRILFGRYAHFPLEQLAEIEDVVVAEHICHLAYIVPPGLEQLLALLNPAFDGIGLGRPGHDALEDGAELLGRHAVFQGDLSHVHALLLAVHQALEVAVHHFRAVQAVALRGIVDLLYDHVYQLVEQGLHQDFMAEALALEPGQQPGEQLPEPGMVMYQYLGGEGDAVEGIDSSPRKLFVHGHLDQVCLDQSQILRNIDILVEGFGIIVEEIEVDAIVPAVLPGRYLQPVLQERGNDAQLVLLEFDILVFEGQCDGAAVHEEEEVVVQNAPGEIIVDVSFYILDISHIEVHFVEIDGVFHGGLLPPVCDAGFVIHNCIILFSAACTSGFCWAGKVGHWDWRWFKAWEEGI